MSRWLAWAATLCIAGCGDSTERRGESTNVASGGSAAASDGGALSAGGNLFENDTDGGTGCERVVEFQAVTLAEPPPFDVVIVADHSDSLSWSKDDLARGLASLLTNLQGRDVRVFVLTPTQYGASTEAAEPWLWGSPLISWKDPVTGVPYPNAMTEYSAECTDGSGVEIPCPEDEPERGTPLIVEGRWDFRMPAPVAVIRRDMTDDELAASTDAVSASILGLGGGGAQVEQPLCTLGRYLLQAPGPLPDNAVFLVISDEDDTTDGRSCLVGHTTSYGTGESLTNCTTGCDEYRHAMTSEGGATQSYGFDCVPVDDFGTQFPELAVPRSVFAATDCAVEGPRPCVDAELAIAARHCAPGSIPLDCTTRCTAGARTCQLTRTDDADLCAESFQEGGATYANFADYCAQTTGTTGWTDCHVRGFNRSQTGGTQAGMVPRRLVWAADTQQLINGFHAKAAETFGADGYKVQTIIMDPAFSCVPEAGQSYGTNLRTLASSPEDVFAICEPYGRALTSVEGFAKQLIQTEYPLAIEADEELTSVEVTDQDGVRRTLAETDFQHDPTTSLLTFSPGTLTARDTALDVEIVADCRPR